MLVRKAFRDGHQFGPLRTGQGIPDRDQLQLGLSGVSDQTTARPARNC